MAGVGGFRGVSAGQDARFSNKQKKQMKEMKFPKELDLKVDMKRVHWPVIKEWIAKRVTELIGLEEEVLIGMIYNHLETTQDLNPKELHVTLVPFLEKNTSLFMKELWSLLASASQTQSGIPQQLLDAKQEELLKRKEQEAAIQGKIQEKILARKAEENDKKPEAAREPAPRDVNERPPRWDSNRERGSDRDRARPQEREREKPQDRERVREGDRERPRGYERPEGPREPYGRDTFGDRPRETYGDRPRDGDRSRDYNRPKEADKSNDYYGSRQSTLHGDRPERERSERERERGSYRDSRDKPKDYYPEQSRPNGSRRRSPQHQDASPRRRSRSPAARDKVRPPNKRSLSPEAGFPDLPARTPEDDKEDIIDVDDFDGHDDRDRKEKKEKKKHKKEKEKKHKRSKADGEDSDENAAAPRGSEEPDETLEGLVQRARQSLGGKA